MEELIEIEQKVSRYLKTINYHHYHGDVDKLEYIVHRTIFHMKDIIFKSSKNGRSSKHRTRSK